MTERIAILADGQLTFGDAKTAFGVIRYGTGIHSDTLRPALAESISATTWSVP